ncbi:MAG: acetyltransferase [Planctomyces sp.]|nr:acetyltransferase [Planctomyces sp.]
MSRFSQPLMIWGAGGHAKVVADSARLAGWTIGGFVDDSHPLRHGRPFFGGLVVGGRETLHSGIAVALALADCHARLHCAQYALDRQLWLPVLAHPRACIASSARIAEGSFLAAGATINPDVVLGVAVIVNTGATVDYDCELDDGVHVAPGVHLAAGVSIGERTLVGIGAVVKPGVRIGSDCTIGAGAVVIRNIPDGTTVYGSPARPRPALADIADSTRDASEPPPGDSPTPPAAAAP